MKSIKKNIKTKSKKKTRKNIGGGFSEKDCIDIYYTMNNSNCESAIDGNGEVSLCSRKPLVICGTKCMNFETNINQRIVQKEPQTFKRKTYFYFERLTSENYSFWELYNQSQNKQIKKIESRVASFMDGLIALKETLEKFKKDPKINYIWIAYSSFLPRDELLICMKKQLEDRSIHRCYDPALKYQCLFELIEMAVSVFYDSNIPISSNIGIHRNFLYLPEISKLKGENLITQTKNLAVSLHAFIAKSILFLCNMCKKIKHPLYMVTRPTRLMAKILIKKFEKDSNGIWLCDLKDRQKEYLTVEEKCIPETYTDDFPLNTLTNEWKLLHNSTEIKFNIPPWFSNTTYGHKYLTEGNDLPLMLVDYEKLSTLF
jgi:hypothetical protein